MSIASSMQKNNNNLAYTDWQLDLPNGLKLVNDLHFAAIKPSLIVFEVTSLRGINETCGRHIGDQLLIDMCNYFTTLEKDEITLYRVSGNKFCLTVYHMPADDLREYAGRLSVRLMGPWNVVSGEQNFSVSCETVMAVILSEFTDRGESLLNVIERTLKAAHQNEKSITVYDETLDQMFKRRRQFEFSLKRCVANKMDGFNVFYQPIANPVTGVWCGLEALCRWTSPELGFVSPNEFIAESERLDLIDTIGLWVLETAIRQCKAWELDKLRMFILDVNVSAVQFADAQLADKIIRILTAHKYPAHKLCIEITESTQFTFTGPAMATFDKLRDAKISIALDDFGTGYSAFNKLKEMPVDIVKIERVFVADIENDSYLRYLFRAIAELVHTAGMRIVAEGVETQEQMNILLKNGADMLQGFLFAKPLSAEELSDKLNLFHETDLDSHMMLRQKIDITKLLKAEDSHILTPFLNRTMFRCIHILLHRENIDEAIQEVIGIAGWAVSVSRVYVFQLLEGHCFANTFEWCNLGTEPQKDNLQRLTLTESLRELIKRDGVIISSDIAELPPDLYDALNPQGIKSMALIPLWEKNTITGFIGFDECKEHRIWWPEEILMLYNISLIIASVMQRLIRQQEGCEAKG